MPSKVHLGEITSKHLRNPAPYAIIAPENYEPLPLCIFLLGAGGTRDALVDLQPVFDAWWADRSIPQMVFATPTPGGDYYIEDADARVCWDSFLALDFIAEVRTRATVSDRILLAGISGGGYGALKLAFARPDLFAAVAAMQPMLEPGLSASDVPPRNRLHHSAGGPKQLVGPDRDAALWEANNPANRARANANAIRDANPAIYLDAADRDFLNAHDGAEFLHRALWDLDISHEYHLVRDADHGGPTMRPRTHAMFAWFGSVFDGPASDTATEQAATAWLESGMKTKAPSGATSTNAFLRFLRAGLEPARQRAAETDPTVARRFGRL